LNNRILKSNAGCANEDKTLSHDANGNLTKLAHLEAMKWDFKNQLVEVQLNKGPKPNKAFYQYDSSGQRIRKLVVRNGGADTSERVYLGDYEIYTETASGNSVKQRETLHVSDDPDRVAIIETEKDLQNPVNLPTILKRFQLSNHLGSATQELNETGHKKRYRYSGKERDDETGLYYYGARYCAPWLGRWVSCDPIGPEDDHNLYQTFLHNPITFIDKNGLNSIEAYKNEKKSKDRSTQPLTHQMEVNSNQTIRATTTFEKYYRPPLTDWDKYKNKGDFPSDLIAASAEDTRIKSQWREYAHKMVEWEKFKKNNLEATLEIQSDSDLSDLIEKAFSYVGQAGSVQKGGVLKNVNARRQARAKKWGVSVSSVRVVNIYLVNTPGMLSVVEETQIRLRGGPWTAGGLRS